MKRIDKLEEEVLYLKKSKQGKRIDLINLEIQRDKDFQEKIIKKQRIKDKKKKKDPKEINRRFKEGIGNLK